MRTREQAIQNLKRQLIMNPNIESLETEDIIAEKPGKILVRKLSLNKFGDKYYLGIRFEIWTDLEKYRQGIPGEEKDGIMYIYCQGIAGTNEEQLIHNFYESK